MAKPFSIQAPEDIAKEYAGNKQMIAQAAQMGVVDPTAAVLAGMFIDRMRSAQIMEGGQQPTVAQQVLGAPQPAAPAPAGLGATPQAAAMPPMPTAPQMGIPPQEMAPQEMPAEEMPMMADGGMVPPYASGGGLSDVPLPDGMFDEPSNGGFGDGYAGGGMIAFAGGGMADLYDDVEYWESGGNQGAISKAGARGVMQLMPGTMKDPGFGVPSIAELRAKGLSEEDANRQSGQKYLDAMYRKYGDEATALAAYNWGPGNVDKWLQKGGDPKKLPAETKKYISNILGGKATPRLPERDIDTQQGRMSSLDDISNAMKRRFGKTPEQQEADDKLRARAEEMGSDEYYEKQRKDSMWETLAAIGFNMASSKSPSLLQAVGEAAAAALPGAQADKKERKQLKDKALNIMVEMGARDRKEAMEQFKVASELWQTGIQQEQFTQELGIKREELQMRQEEFNTRRYEAEQAAIAAGQKFDLDKYLVTEIAAGGDRKKNAEAFMGARYGGSGSGAGRFDKKLQGETETVAPGTVQDGYKFKGGDPSVESNWERVK